MPISVPKSMKSYLEEAVTLIHGANTLNDAYTKIKKHLDDNNVSYKTHNDHTTVPSDHAWLHPKDHM